MCSTYNTERFESEAESFTDILGRAFGEQPISCGSRLSSLPLALQTLIIIAISIHTVAVTVIAQHFLEEAGYRVVCPSGHHGNKNT